MMITELTSFSYGSVGKKSKPAAPIGGILPRFVPSATISRSTSKSVVSAPNSRAASTVAAANTVPSEPDFKMGGFENSEESDASARKYPKYVEASAVRGRGSQVHDY